MIPHVDKSGANLIAWFMALCLCLLAARHLANTASWAADIPLADDWKVYADDALTGPLSVNELAKRYQNHRHFWNRLDGWISYRVNRMNFRDLAVFHQFLYVGLILYLGLLLRRLFPNAHPLFWLAGLIPFLSNRMIGVFVPNYISHYLYQGLFLLGAIHCLFLIKAKPLVFALGCLSLVGVIMANGAGFVVATPIAVLALRKAIVEAASLRKAAPQLVLSGSVLVVVLIYYLFHEFQFVEDQNFVAKSFGEVFVFFFMQLSYPITGRPVPVALTLLVGGVLLWPLFDLMKRYRSWSGLEMGQVAFLLGVLVPMVGLGVARGGSEMGLRHAFYGALFFPLSLGLWSGKVARARWPEWFWLVGVYLAVLVPFSFEPHRAPGWIGYQRAVHEMDLCLSFPGSEVALAQKFCPAKQRVDRLVPYLFSFISRYSKGESMNNPLSKGTL